MNIISRALIYAIVIFGGYGLAMFWIGLELGSRQLCGG